MQILSSQIVGNCEQPGLPPDGLTLTAMAMSTAVIANRMKCFLMTWVGQGTLDSLATSTTQETQTHRRDTVTKQKP